MSLPLIFATDLVAIGLLTFALYFPRHRRRDLVGLGLFGVRSIIRLRSTELDQHEVAYYFSALALGLLGGLGVGLGWTAVALMAAVVAVLAVGDHPRLLPRYRQQVVVLDAAVTDEAELRARLADALGARVHTMTVQRVDLVNDITTVDVRYEVSGVARGQMAPARHQTRAGIAAGALR
ncbi:DUF4956 domain-containing protein [Cellulomonas hominis]